VQIDNDEEFDLHEIIASPQSKKIQPAISIFAHYPRELWKLNQKDFLTLWMAIALKFNHDYIAFVLNYPTANAVGARIRNFKKKGISYSADGRSNSLILVDCKTKRTKTGAFTFANYTFHHLVLRLVEPVAF
jgi:hypothetical protein